MSESLKFEAPIEWHVHPDALSPDGGTFVTPDAAPVVEVEPSQTEPTILLPEDS